MPTIWVYSGRVADTVEEWVEDQDWDQQSWDEWDRMEAMYQAGMRRRMSPGNYTNEWHNMTNGGAPSHLRRPRF